MHLRRHGNLERTIMATPIPASSILDALPSEVSRGLFAQGRSVSLDAEQTLFLAGDKGDGCLGYVVSPLANVFKMLGHDSGPRGHSDQGHTARGFVVGIGHIALGF